MQSRENFGTFEKFQPLMIAAISAALFLPMMGRGFMQDDFDHLYSVAHYPFSIGLARVQGGPFYAPVAWLSYKIDWMLWGANPFAFAATNLMLHLTNIIVLYYLADRLWQSKTAARWAAIGYSLLYPASVSAVMFIGTRAHLLVTLFYLGSMLAAAWLVKTDRHQLLAAIMAVAFAALAIFSKESGVMAPVAIALVLLHQGRGKSWGQAKIISVICMSAALIVLLWIYLVLRSNSGAIQISFNCSGYSYCLSLMKLLENYLRYFWRTFGLVAIIAFAITISKYIKGHCPHLGFLTKYDLLLSIALFTITIAPVVLMSYRSGIYSYLPGISAALLLGAVVRSLHESTLKESPLRLKLVAAAPVILVVFIYFAFTLNSIQKWMKIAVVNTAVLNQITQQHNKAKPWTMFILRYGEEDKSNMFPDGMEYGFPYALRFLYSDPSLNGKIIRHDKSCDGCHGSTVINMVYTLRSDGTPAIITYSNE